MMERVRHAMESMAVARPWLSGHDGPNLSVHRTPTLNRGYTAWPFICEWLREPG